MPKVLFIGDIVGRPGRQAVIRQMIALRSELGADLVVANAENAAGGAGLTGKIASELFAAGVDAITLGDHVWDQKNFENEIDAYDNLCRPANLPKNNPGKPFAIISKGSFRLGVVTVLGRNYMGLKAECPFLAVTEMMEFLERSTDAILVEAHMEATSEKIALGWYLDGKASAVIGTHTHVPTADARILPRGTAYLTDAGMTGPYDSVLGREIKPVVDAFLDGMKRRFEVASGNVRICGCLVEIDETTGRALAIERVDVPVEL